MTDWDDYDSAMGRELEDSARDRFNRAIERGAIELHFPVSLKHGVIKIPCCKRTTFNGMEFLEPNDVYPTQFQHQVYECPNCWKVYAIKFV